MICNPCSFYINGCEELHFTYEGGSKLYHFSPYDNGLEPHMGCNVIFFANDEKHALDVLKRMFEFRLECGKKYIENKDGYLYDVDIKMNQFTRYLNALNKGDIKVVEAPTNQFYKVGWAGNDTI